MNYIIFLLLIAFSIVFIVLGLFILRPKFENKEFREDKLIKSDDKTYALFELDNEYQEFLNSYKIFKHGDRRFLTLIKNDGINYIEYNIICFKNEKYLQTIKIKDTNIRKNEEYLVNLPINATSFKVDIVQINDTLFETKDIKKTNVIKELLASLLFAFASIAPVTLIENIVFNEFSTNYYNKDRVLEFTFNKPAIYISIIVLAVLVFIISFLILFFKNKRKTFKFKSNKKEVDYGAIDFKYKVKKDNYSNSKYYKVECLFPKGFINGIVVINVFKNDNTLAISFNKIITKHDYKFNIKKEDDFDRLEFEVLEANFDTYSYKDDEYKNFEFVNKDGVKAKKLTTYGVLSSLIVFLCVFGISIGGVLNSYSSLSPFINPEGYFGYSYLDDENKEDGVQISDYYGSNKTMITPKTLNGYSVKKIKYNSFKDSKRIHKVAFDSSIEIGNSAFESASLFQVDLTNVTTIGNSAFKETYLTSLTIPSSVTSINSEAFRGIRTLTSLTFDEGSSKLSLSSESFRYIKVWGDIEIKRNIGSMSSTVFKNASFKVCYVYSTIDGVNKTNYRDYFNKNTEVYFINHGNCNHDYNSFILKNGSKYIDFDGELISKEAGTCIERSKHHYRCKVCGDEMTLYGQIDENNHNYVNGKCTWCGKTNN